jgi:hypothetical protein
MFAKTLAIAIVLAGTAGASASYVHNHSIPWRTVWHEATRVRPPLAPAPYDVAKFVPAKHYRFCRNQFRTKMTHLPLARKQEACKCFDRTVQSWTLDMQQARKIVSLGKTVMAENPAARAFSNIGRMQQLGGNGPEHQRHVLASQLRDQAWHIQKDYRDTLNGKGGKAVVANPLLLIAANYKVERVFAKCGMNGSW